MDPFKVLPGSEFNGLSEGSLYFRLTPLMTLESLKRSFRDSQRTNNYQPQAKLFVLWKMYVLTLFVRDNVQEPLRVKVQILFIVIFLSSYFSCTVIDL